MCKGIFLITLHFYVKSHQWDLVCCWRNSLNSLMITHQQRIDAQFLYICILVTSFIPQILSIVSSWIQLLRQRCAFRLLTSVSDNGTDCYQWSQMWPIATYGLHWLPVDAKERSPNACNNKKQCFQRKIMSTQPKTNAQNLGQWSQNLVTSFPSPNTVSVQVWSKWQGSFLQSY